MTAAPDSAAPDSALTDLRLPAILDLRSAASLARRLLARRGDPIRLDASGIERLGGLGLQVLLSARATWRADQLDFALVDPSEAFRADCAALGARLFDDFEDARHG